MSATPLTNTIERVDRSLFERLRTELVDKGYLPDITDTLTYPDNQTGTTAFEAALAAIRVAKGFAIELFGVASNEAKYKEKVPRIVIVSRNGLLGALGGSPDRVYTAIPQNPLQPLDPDTNPLDHFDAHILPPQTSDFEYEIALVWQTVVQRRIMLQILALALPKRGYINWWDQGATEVERPFIRQVGFDDRTMADQGFREEKYIYVVEDIFETANVPAATPIAPITEIKVEERTVDPNQNTPDATIVVTPS